MGEILFDAFASLLTGGLASATTEICIRHFYQPPSAAFSIPPPEREANGQALSESGADKDTLASWRPLSAAYCSLFLLPLWGSIGPQIVEFTEAVATLTELFKLNGPRWKIDETSSILLLFILFTKADSRTVPLP